MAQYPPLTIYDENDEAIGEAMLEDILEKSLIHRVIHILVEDEYGNVLLQLRGPNVLTDPNTWGFAVGWYVDAGEDYLQAARRELDEELGVENAEIQDLGIKYEQVQVDKYPVKRFVGTFKVILPSSIKFQLQESEVSQVRWFTKEELRDLIISEDPKLVPYIRGWLNSYYFENENNEH